MGETSASEMVERVARALCRLQCERNRRHEPIDDAAMQRVIGHNWPEWVTEAQAAIEAMSYPTEAMERAFDRAYWDKQHDNYSPTPTEHPEDGGGPFGYGYRAMMKAALAAPSL